MSDLQKLSGFNSHSYKTPQIKASQTSVSLVRTGMNTFKSGVEAESFVNRYSWFLPFFTHGFMIHSHRRTGNFLPRGAVNHLPKFLQNSRKETRAIRCSNIGRTGIWKWLDTVFQGQYLPSLSINYVAINKHLEKLPPQLCQIKMKICYNQGCNDIGVVIATKWHPYLLYMQQFFSLGTVLTK